MKNKIYFDNEYRCKITYDRYMDDYTLQLQKKIFIFWYNVGAWMTVKEGFWGECEELPIIRGTYQYGNDYEVYMTGTLNLKQRCIEFYNEYIEQKKLRDNNEKRLYAVCLENETLE